MDYLVKWRDRKKELKITNLEIAQKAGIPLRTVEQIMAGKVKAPRMDTVNAIEKVLYPREPFYIPLLDFLLEDDGELISEDKKSDIIIDKDYYIKNVKAFSSGDSNGFSEQQLNGNSMFAYKMPNDSMKPWYFKNDIVICVKTDRLFAQRDYVVIYDDNKPKLRHVLIEDGKQGVDFVYYFSPLQPKTANKIITHVDDKDSYKLLGMVVQVIRDTMTESFLLKR